MDLTQLLPDLVMTIVLVISFPRVHCLHYYSDEDASESPGSVVTFPKARPNTRGSGCSSPIHGMMIPLFSSGFISFDIQLQ